MGGNNQATADTLPLFRRTTTLTVQLDADITTNVDLAILTPGYTFATPVLGGRLGFNLYVPVGSARTQIDQLVTGALGPIGFANQSSISDRLTSFGDPAPQLCRSNGIRASTVSWSTAGAGFPLAIIIPTA